MTIFSINSDKSLTSNERIWKKGSKIQRKEQIYKKSRIIHEVV